jgi:chromosome segregation ATPase
MEPKAKIFLIGIRVAFLAWLVNACNQPTQHSSESETGEDYQTALQDVDQAMHIFEEEKDLLITEIEAEIDLVESRIENYRNELDEESRSYSEEIKQAVMEKVDRLKGYKKDLKDQLSEVRNSGYDNWGNTKETFQRAYQDLHEHVREVGEEVNALFE